MKGLRPTSNRVREALFDILRGKIEGRLFLDLYAGTGAVGINAIKEGASEVIFIEENKSSAKKINALAEKMHCHEKATIVNKKVLSYIESVELHETSYDIIFLDPPYHSDEILDALYAIAGSEILKKDGIVIAEHFSKKELPDCFDTLRKVKDYSYGDTVLSFYRR